MATKAVATVVWYRLSQPVLCSAAPLSTAWQRMATKAVATVVWYRLSQPVLAALRPIPPLGLPLGGLAAGGYFGGRVN